MFLKEYIFSYNKTNAILNELCQKHSNVITKEKPIGYTSFDFPINYYKIGNGKKDVILISGTHGCEIVTVTFIMQFIHTLIHNKNKFNKYLNKYIFHIIPILNPEGYIISSSNVLHSTKLMNKTKLENFSKKYLELYNKDDENSKKNIKQKKNYKNLMNTSCNYIPYLNLRNNVEKILKNCDLTDKVLPIWQTNGMGIDLNANSIHEFKKIKILKNKQKFGKLRYNDIPVDKPSPHGFPGDKTFDEKCPENLYLYDFINKIYNKNNLKLFISYHSTGGEIYGYPDINLVSNKQYNIIKKGMDYYSFYTKYIPINENFKYGVMDYYRIYLKNTITLTIELSILNGNPIGPFSNLDLLNKEFKNNINSIFYTLDKLN